MNIFEISEKDILLNFIRELIKRNKIKALRNLLKNNLYCKHFNTKDLNNQFNINGYKWTGKIPLMIRVLNDIS